MKKLLELVNTDIQFFATKIKEKNNGDVVTEYYVANIVKVVDALCLDKSQYFETEIEGIGIILLRLLNIAIFNSHIFQYISACYA